MAMVNRSPVLAVQVVSIRNKDGKFWHVNISVDNSPYKNLGPFTEPITVPEALQLVAVEFKLQPFFLTN